MTYKVGDTVKDELDIEWTIVESYRGNARLSSDEYPNRCVTVDCYGQINNHPLGWFDIFLVGSRERSHESYPGIYCPDCYGRLSSDIGVYKRCECGCEDCGGGTFVCIANALLVR